MIFEGFDYFWGFDGFYSLFDRWVKGELDDGARSAVTVLDDGGLIVDGGLGCV